ncbi:MAG: peptidylprolyl isomerase [Gammaproteobacteria bacterium]
MSEQRVDERKVVYFTYEIRDSAGNLLERSDLPIGYLHGGGKRELLDKLEASLEGRAVGDTVEVTLTPEEGFGRHKPELTYTDNINNVPSEYCHLGAEALFANDQGETITMVVTRIENGQVTLDGNHPLAGHTLVYRITVSDIREATESELQVGTLGDRARILQ